MESVLKGSTMEERAQSLLETNIGSDCDFLVGSEENKVLFKANKIFLTKASPVFERMLYGGLQPSYPIEVPDIEPEVFHLMLKYMYGCKWTFESNEQAVSVCYGAHKYMLKELLDRCVEYLWPCCVDDVWIALQCASLYYLNDLKKASLQIVQVNSHEFFASRNFEHLGKSSLIDILQLDYMNVTSEIEIFESVNQWAIAQCTEKGLIANERHLRNEVEDLIKYIRFLSMSSAEFAEGPGESDLLTTEEKLAILKTIVTNGNIPPPSNICPNWNPRKEAMM